MTANSRPEIKAMAHIKCRYFAKLARELGDEVTV